MAPTAKRPERPKRAPTAYMMFMKKYLRSQSLKSRKDAQKAIKAGAKKWHSLSQQEKDRYLRASMEARDEWLQAMATYRTKMLAIKRPPTPFAAFLKDYYWSEFGGQGLMGMKVPELCKEAAAKWHQLDAREREGYGLRYRMQMENYHERMERQQQEEQEEDVMSGEWEPAYQMPSTSAQAKESEPCELEESMEDRAKRRAARFKARRERMLKEAEANETAIASGYEADGEARSDPTDEDALAKTAGAIGKRRVGASAGRPSKAPRKASKSMRKASKSPKARARRVTPRNRQTRKK